MKKFVNIVVKMLRKSKKTAKEGSFFNPLLLLVYSSILSVCSSFAEPKKLLLNDIHWPPFLFSQSQSQYKGFAKDVLNVCLSRMNYRAEYVNLPVKRTHIFMQTGDLDITLYSYKKSRTEFVNYATDPLFVSEYGFVTAKKRNIDIQSLDDLAPYIVGHLAGLSHTPELSKILEYKRNNEQLLESNNVEIMLSQLLSDPPRIDIIPNSKETFLWRIKQNGLEDKLQVLDYIVSEKQYFVTLSKFSKNVEDQTLFLSEMDDCTKSLKRNGQYHQIGKKYGF